MALSLVALLLPEVLYVTVGPNFHTVLAGRFYRAGQPSGAAIKGYVREHGIRTVINLRGPNNDGEDWYEDEKLAAARCHIQLVNINMSASDKPQEQEVRKLIKALDESPEPLLVHCNSGSDRSGFASTCFLLLKTDATWEEAKAQLSLRYGHFAWGKAGCLTRVLGQYKQWLDSHGWEHRPDRLRQWASTVYVKDDLPKK